MYNSTIEDQFFKTKTDKKPTPDKKNHTIETFKNAEAIKNALETEGQNNDKNKYYNNLTKKKKNSTERIRRLKRYNYYKSR